MIRFAALTPSLAQPGGAERTILLQVRYADPARMACTGVAVSPYGGVDEDLGRELTRYTTIHGPPAEGSWSRAPAPLIRLSYRHLNEAVRHVCRDADVLVTWGSLAMGAHTADLDIPVVCVSHCSSPSASTVGGITHLVAVSKAARRFFAGAPGVEGLPVAVIPNGVEVDRICPRRGRAWQRDVWGVGEDDRVLLYLGRQAADKNPQAAVMTLGWLPHEYKLIMIGNQSFRPAEPLPTVAKMVEDMGLSGRVMFLPPISHVGDALSGADCLLHLSVREADSLVVKEAFLAGLPVVHTPVGSIPEMMDEFGQVGWGVPLRPDVPAGIDTGVAARQVQAALTDAGRDVAAKMRAIAWERWTGPAMCERWADYLEGVVNSWHA